MNRGVSESSPVLQQLMAAGNPNWWNVSGDMRPPPPSMGHLQGSLPPQMTPNNNYLRPRVMPTFLPQFLPYPATSSLSSSSSSSPSLPSNPNLSSWLENNELPPESWSLSQLLLGGGLMMGEEERLEIMNHHNHHDGQQHHSFQGNMRLENWEEQVLSHRQSSMGVVDIKQESNINNNNGYLICSPNSPLNSVTTATTTSINSNDDNSNNNNSKLDFSSNHDGLKFPEGRHSPPDRSSECNSLEINGSTNKKPKLQPSPPSQSTLKVRKEKLGGRIAALHQLVSPFGKTDTASVLSEAIGYIRFLHSQIEALSHPYFSTTASGNMRQQQHLQGERSCFFPEDPGQLVNDQCMKRKGASSSSMDKNANEESKKDLKSRGLCLVPISCTLQVGSDNGADYWAPALGSAGFQY